MKAWIAKSKSGRLALHTSKPKLCKDEDTWWDTTSGEGAHFDDSIGEGVTFENSPQEIELVRKGE